MQTMDFSVASPMETIGYKTKSSVFGEIQVFMLKGRDGEHAVDPTLSIQGDSADAKATGDAIDALDTRMTDAETALSGLASVSGHKLIITLPTA